MKKIDLESKYSEKIQVLFELGREHLMGHEGFDYKKFHFEQDDVSELIKLATDYSYDEIEDKKLNARFFYATIHAWTVLGRLKALESVPFLFKKMREERGNNELFNEIIVSYIGDIGSKGLDLIEENIFANPVDYELLSVFDGIDRILEKEPSSSSRIEELVIRYLKNDKTHAVPLSFAISTLIDIGEDKHIDLIRETFKTKEVDELLRGDLEEIEISLGLRENPYLNQAKIDSKKMMENFEANDKLEPKIGRNDPCPCGSGKKYKKCCLNK